LNRLNSCESSYGPETHSLFAALAIDDGLFCGLTPSNYLLSRLRRWGPEAPNGLRPSL